MTLIYFTATSILETLAFTWGKVKTIDIMDIYGYYGYF